MQIAHPARVAPVLKVLASAAYLGAFFTVRNDYPQLYAGFIFLPVAALTVVRHLRGLTLTPALHVDDAGVRVKTWDTRFMIPWVFVEERTIAWSDFKGATVHTLRVNGMASSSLVIRDNAGSIEIRPGVFSEDADDIQLAILDRYGRRAAPVLGDRPARGAEASPEVTRPRTEPALRAAAAPVSGRGPLTGGGPLTGDGPARDPRELSYANPILIQNRSTMLPASIAAAIAVAVAVVCATATGLPWFLWIWLAAVPMLFSVGMLRRYTLERGVRRIELRADGFAFGPAEDLVVVMPWKRVVYAMLSSTNGKPTNVRVAFEGGASVVLHGDYDRSLPEIRALIDPPKG